MTNPTPLFSGADPRAASLVRAILATISERGDGMPFPTILGCIRLAELQLVSDEVRA